MAKTRVASINDIREGVIHGVTIGDTELILVRTDGRIRALGGRCPHHDAPLADGLLDGNHVLCPWHQSVFDATDGALVEPPALDGLATYDVELDGDDVIVDLPNEDQGNPQPKTVTRDRSTDNHTIVIVGGGAAGLSAAQEIRRADYRGRLVMVSEDPYPPYDRPNCSKDFLAGEAPAEWLPLKPLSFYQDAGIERIEHRADTIDVTSRRIAFPGGSSIDADGLLLATGGEPKTLDVPGSDLEGITTLRSRSDCERIGDRVDTGARVVVVGASFIGMEVAASLTQRGANHVTVVAPDDVPFENTLGPRVGALFEETHRGRGVDFRLGTSVAGFEGNGSVRAVALDNGHTLDADLVVIGVGVKPATDGIEGIDLEPDGSVRVDELLSVRPGVFAAGDIATFPDWRTGEPTRIEHWRTALQQGIVAGRNLAGETRPFRAVPFFWTMQFDAGIGYVGHAVEWDDEIVHGDLDDRDFMIYYVRGGRVLAGAAMGRDRQLSALHELMALEREPFAEDLRDRDLDLVDLLRG